MNAVEYKKIIYLMNKGAIQGIDTGRLNGKCEDVIPIKDAITIVDSVYKTEIKSQESEVEWLKTIIEDAGSNEELSPEEWNTILLTSIANSLAIIADTFKR